MRAKRQQHFLAYALLPLVAVPLLLAACLDSITENQSEAFAEAAALEACSVTGKNRRIRNVMNSWYLYVDQMPDRDPADFSSPQAMLEALMVNPPDRFSFLDDRERALSFTEEGRRIGLGLSLILVAEPDDYRVVEVIEGSPAAEAGMARGDRLLTINYRSVEDWFLNEGLGAAFGPDEEGVAVAISVRRPDGSEYSVKLQKEEFPVDPVTALSFFELDDGRTVAYFLFRSFIEPARDRLDEVFGQLQDAEVDELIVDLRYNGGGRVGVAEQLASQVGGESLVDEVFVRFVHNDARRDEDLAIRFSETVASLGLERLVVVGTARTASASELIVNNLRPFMEVDIIGERTFGKPVGSYAFEVCELLLFPVSFALLNAEGEGDYFAGLPATCEAEDGLDSALGDEAEASLAQALHFIDTGQCDVASAGLARERAAEAYRPEAGGREGWHPEQSIIR